MTALVIVESPAKAKTINRYLGKDFTVVASYGHVRDLPSKNGSVDPAANFAMIWEIDARSKKQIDAIIKEVKQVDEVYLATDPDREGEAISWHIAQILKEKGVLKNKKISRIVFNEITKTAIKQALQNPREVNDELVEAYLARRALDYLVGFNISPVLWRKLPGSRSAGRVQSVALKLIVKREQEIEAFISEEYWSIAGLFEAANKENFQARLTHFDGQKLEKMSVKNEVSATSIVEGIKKHSYAITSIEKKQVKRNPAAPFITSTLQQEASRKLGFGASRTMQVAQKLYEGVSINGESTGLITYMRTDGVQLSNEAVENIRAHIEKQYGEKYLPQSPIVYKTKAKNAQEAHEAIRPTDISRTPDDVKPFLDEAQYKLYKLIWKRAIACQMSQAIFDQVNLFIKSDHKKHQFKATGTTLVFDGFLRVYQEGTDDEKKDDDENMLPLVKENENLSLLDVLSKQHFTEPPPRYSEASLVKKLEELSIGRPSTYASIIQVLQDRSYVELDKRVFFPTDRGRIVTSFLEHFFSKYVEFDFTAKLEDQLDEISDGKLDWLKVMHDFWKPFHGNVESTMKIDIGDVIHTLEKDMDTYLFGDNKEHICPKCNQGKLGLKLGKFGSFLGCSDYPECSFTKPVGNESSQESGNLSFADEPKVIGQDPLTGNDITLRKGPYGFYLQWEGEIEGAKAEVKEEAKTENGKPAKPKKTKKKSTAPKPKRIGLPMGFSPDTITLDQAMFLKTIPLPLGIFPDTEEAMSLGIGKFGPYVKVGSVFASVPKTIPLMSVDEEAAITIVRQKLSKAKGKSEPAYMKYKNKKKSS